MSVFGLENALWQATTNPRYAQRLREEAESYLSEFKVNKRERELMVSWDVRSLVELGVNPMVLMMANAAVNGPDAAASYIQKVNTPNTAPAPR